MSKRFVTLFPICQNVHLTKDLGQIPFFLHHVYKYDSTITCYKNETNYSNLKGEVNGLKIKFIENTGTFSFLEKGVLSYLKKESKNIDVLNLYIFSKFSFVYGILYKKYNPNGFLFLKLDGYNETFTEGNKIKHSTNPIKNVFFKFLEKKFLSKVDLITIENSLGEQLVKNKYPQIANKVKYIPVGVNDLYLKEHFITSFNTFEQKENIFLTVGRIGEKIKNNEMMLRALSKLNMKDWKMVFVGAINPEFEIYFNSWILEYPHLKEKLIFTGEIKDRNILYDWYNKSKVFCMTSVHESFCHSIGEALYFGNYIIGTSGIVSLPDLTNNGKYGATIPLNDDKSMAILMQQIIDEPNYLKPVFPEILKYAHQNFVWSKIVEKIYNRIENR